VWRLRTLTDSRSNISVLLRTGMRIVGQNCRLLRTQNFGICTSLLCGLHVGLPTIQMLQLLVPSSTPTPPAHILWQSSTPLQPTHIYASKLRSESTASLFIVGGEVKSLMATMHNIL